MLCQACTNIFAVAKDKPTGFWYGDRPTMFAYPERKDAWAGAHHPESSQFLLAVDDKCYICSTIHRDLRLQLRLQLRQQASLCRTFYQLRHLLSTASAGAKRLQDHYELEFMFEFTEAQEPLPREMAFGSTGIFIILPQEEIIVPQEKLELTENTFSGLCKKRVREWLQICKSSHVRCNVDWRSQESKPDRLLKIENATRFSLQDIKDGTQCPPYVTLSHCWDEEMPFKLTLSSLEKLAAGVLISKLPKTFREAMEIAQWMNHSYIWIDAYCIIQDSDQDWLEQSSKMGDIYAGSSCNIAATRDGLDVGCFTTRYTAMVEPYLIPNPLTHDPALSHVIGYNDFWSNSLLDTRLNNRCWVYQERLLSPRTIHFGQEQIFWECRCQMACEAYHNGIPEQFRNHKTLAWRKLDRILDPDYQHEQSQATERRPFWRAATDYLARLALRNTSKPNLVVPFEIYGIWGKIIERYMECKLSFSKDKLVAISGIAQRVAAATGDRYLAGLWDNALLPQSLLWYVVEGKQADNIASFRSPSFGQQGYRAPSWSWASLEARITWHYLARCDKVLLKIVDTTVDGQQGSRMGAVASAKMLICGNLFQGNIKVLNRRSNGTPDEDGQYGLVIEEQGSSIDTETGARNSNSETSVQSLMEPTIYLDTPMMPKASSLDVYLLPVCTGWKGRPAGIITDLAGLLLRKSETSHLAYERLGVFCMDQKQAATLYRKQPNTLNSTDDAHSTNQMTIPLI